MSFFFHLFSHCQYKHRNILQYNNKVPDVSIILFIHSYFWEKKRNYIHTEKIIVLFYLKKIYYTRVFWFNFVSGHTNFMVLEFFFFFFNESYFFFSLNLNFYCFFFFLSPGVIELSLIKYRNFYLFFFSKHTFYEISAQWRGRDKEGRSFFFFFLQKEKKKNISYTHDDPTPRQLVLKTYWRGIFVILVIFFLSYRKIVYEQIFNFEEKNWAVF